MKTLIPQSIHPESANSLGIFKKQVKSCKGLAKTKATGFLEATQHETITAVGSGNGKSALFTEFQLFQVFLSLVSSAYMWEKIIIGSFFMA